jgi:hypothetical protein
VIQPYRLEMGVSLRTARGGTLYDFWGDRISKALNADAKGHAEKTLINLASQEYFGAVDARALKLRLITVVFREEKDGQARTLAFYAKRARGMMSALGGGAAGGAGGDAEGVRRCGVPVRSGGFHGGGVGCSCGRSRSRSGRPAATCATSNPPAAKVSRRPSP